MIKKYGKNKIAFYCLALLILIFTGCSNNYDTQKKYKEKFYKSGRIKSRGWYIKDTITVDSLLSYFESGKILGKDFYDSIGNSEKSITYFEDGKINKVINYENGLANGFFYTNFTSGNIKSKAFFVNDNQTGDTYYYMPTNVIKAYCFFDWKERPLNLVKYDSAGNVFKDMRQVIYLDSIKILHDNVKKNHTPIYEIQIVVSNPPKCKSIINIIYLSKNNNLMRSDSVINKPYYFKTDRLKDSLTSINILGSLYDSTKNKTFFQKSKMNLEYQKDDF